MNVPSQAAAWNALPFAYGVPPSKGTIRASPEDFQVEERLPFEPAGTGEHALVQITKRGCNTLEAVRRLAAFAGVNPSHVGRAGLKDRHAVTTQWLSFHLPGRSVDWNGFSDPEITIETVARHNRKLRPGALQGNRFRITVRNLEGAVDAIMARLEKVAEGGVPNYFGVQRFGRDGRNLAEADRLLTRETGHRRLRRGEVMALSAARAYLFNRVASARVQDETWYRALPGDVLMLAGSRSVFALEDSPDARIIERVEAGDLSPTGPLWGRSGLVPTGQAAEAEQAALAGSTAWREGIERYQKRLERRSLRLAPQALRWAGSGPLELAFTLPPGAYATAVLREVIEIGEAPALDEGSAEE